jgi:hypothetical protein
MYDVITTFNHGHARFFKNEQVSPENFTPEDLGRYVNYGWLRAPGAAAVPLPTNTESTLEIADGVIGHHAEY